MRARHLVLPIALGLYPSLALYAANFDVTAEVNVPPASP